MAARSKGVNALSTADRQVLVLITGGTIVMQDSADGLIPTKDFVRNCLTPSSDFDDGSVVPSVHIRNEFGGNAIAPTLRPPQRSPAVPAYTYSVLEFSELIDSSSMNGSHWNQIVRCLQLNWPEFDAFVILHGTDTLAYTASALAFMLGGMNKTVIVTGSQLSMYAPDNDAHDNLLDSLTVAASYDISEVSVVFHHHLYHSTRVTKISSFSIAGFTTPNTRPLANFTGDRGRPWTAHIHSGIVQPASYDHLADVAMSSRKLTNVTTTVDTTRVAVLKIYPGISASLISSIVHIPNLGGLVLETFGAGNIPTGTGERDLLNVLAAAVTMGVVVVSVTQCLTGSVTTSYESARRMERCGVVTGLDMTTEAAYTKLAYLLSLSGSSHGKVSAMMREDLRGELTADFRKEQRAHDTTTTSAG